MRDISTVESDEYSNSNDEALDGNFVLSHTNNKTVQGDQYDDGKDLREDFRKDLRQVVGNHSYPILVAFIF